MTPPAISLHPGPSPQTWWVTLPSVDGPAAAVIAPFAPGFHMEAGWESQVEWAARCVPTGGVAPVDGGSSRQGVLRAGTSSSLPVLARFADAASAEAALMALFSALSQVTASRPPAPHLAAEGALAPSDAPLPGSASPSPAAGSPIAGSSGVSVRSSGSSARTKHALPPNVELAVGILVALLLSLLLVLVVWLAYGRPGLIGAGPAPSVASIVPATGTVDAAPAFDFDAALREQQAQAASSARIQAPPSLPQRSLSDTLNLSPVQVGGERGFNWQSGPLPPPAAPETGRAALTPAPYAALVATVAPSTPETARAAAARGLRGSVGAIGAWTVPDAIPLPDHVSADAVVNPGDFLIQALEAPSVSRADLARSMPFAPARDAASSSRMSAPSISPSSVPTPAAPPPPAPADSLPEAGIRVPAGGDAFIEAAGGHPGP